MAKEIQNKKENELKNIDPLINKKWYLVAKGYSNKQGLSVQDICEILGSEITKTITRDIDPEAEIIFELDDAKEEAIISNLNMQVVANDFEFLGEDDLSHISFITLAQAQEHYPDVQVDDFVKMPIDFNILNEKNRTAIKNGFVQSLKTKEKLKIYEKYRNLIGKKIKARVLTRNNNGSFNLVFEDGVTAFLPANKVNKKLNMLPGSLVDVYLENVEPESKLSQCQVSTDSPNKIVDLLINEIPEISQGIIEIVNVQRASGERSKVSVRSSDPNIDAVSSVIGVNGKRIATLSDSLDGEKIDVVYYSDDLAEYVKNALSPAKVIDCVVADPKKPNIFAAIIKKEDLTTAIGKKGINVELAKSLTNTKIDILTPEEATQKGIKFKNESRYEKPLFNNHKSKKSSRSSNNFFSDLDIDLNEFKEDVSAFKERMNLSEEVSFNSSTEANTEKPQNKANKSNDRKAAAIDLDQLFDVEKNLEQLNASESNDNDYDFINDIDFDKVFDDAVAENQQELVNYVTEQKEIKAKEKQKQKNNKNSNIRLDDFKVDADLTNYGLDKGLDLSEFDDEWEK
ncbi:transcription termination/antitermination protein NusA [Mycoplasmopsis ciconiae]|uniref:Transcription termination/antitermination protein NusA n=1 Tax=Mycoplasmopsis ciconiae TaxID=561067 RepID=A0ABU7MMP3_9BACT|nr:transcription termination/antitermination protein NusA [Mycoplasmopsis ciconiae]